MTQKTIRNNYKLSFFLLILILSVIGSTLIYYVTNLGLWAFSDFAAYISSAKNFNRGWDGMWTIRLPVRKKQNGNRFLVKGSRSNQAECQHIYCTEKVMGCGCICI